MKKLFTLIALCAFFVGCNSDDPISSSDELTIDEALLNINVNGDENTVNLKFTTTADWTAAADTETANWVTLTQLHGKAGNISLSFDTKTNATGAERKGTITISAGSTKKVITITQAALSAIEIAKTAYEIGVAGGEIEVEVKSNADFTCTPSEKWITFIDKTPSTTTTVPPTIKVRFRIDASNNTDRGASITFTFEDIEKTINIVQGYISTDYTQDSNFYTLQTATEGEGINIILMGDAYTDRLIADGTYKKTMEKGMEAFFSVEPYKSFRHLFNVHVVNSVSKYGTYMTGAETAFNCTLKDKVICDGDQKKCFTYAKKIDGIGGAELEKAVVIVLMNMQAYAGTCYLSGPAVYYSSNYGNGNAIAFFPMGTDDTMFNQILVHEACGHGFPKLTDEYRYSGHVTEADLKQIDAGEHYGWFKNISTTDEKYAIKWSGFLTDSRYANDGVGIFEGGRTFETGLFRPSEESIMSNNLGRFNAPSREAIYYRIHKLAYGESWVYDYEEFVKYDAINRIEAAKAPRTTQAAPYKPLPAPIITGL